MKKIFGLLFISLFAINSFAQKTGNTNKTNQSADTSFWGSGSIFNNDDEPQDFVSQAAMEAILDAVHDKSFKNFLPAGVTEQANKLLPTTLPKTGKEGNYTVNYQTDGKGSYFTLVVLSNNSSENAAAAKFVVGLADKMAKHKCLYRRPKDAMKSRSGDTTVVKFGDDIMYGSDDYLEWMVYPMANSASEKYVVLLIKTIPNSIIEEQKRNAVKAVGIYDKAFCDDVQAIIKESRNGFANVRGEGKKDKYGDLVFSPSLKHRYFSEANITAKTETDFLDGRVDYTIYVYEAKINIAKPEAEALKEFNTVVKKLDACLDFATRTPKNITEFGMKGMTMDYTLKNTSVKISCTVLFIKENHWLLSLDIVDKAAKGK